MSAQLGLFAPAAPTIEGIDVRAALASYSSDLIADHRGSRVRRPVSCGGDLWVSTGGAGIGAVSYENMYRLVPLAEFDGEATTYREKLSVVRDGDRYAGDYARSDPNGFYHGMTVKHGCQPFVLCGPPLVLEATDPDFGSANLFADEDDERGEADEDGEESDEACDGCGVFLRLLDSYHVLVCGVYCDACSETHAAACKPCAEVLETEHESLT